MVSETFRALILEQGPDGATRAEIKSLERQELPAGDVLVRVAYSDLNYKDALAVTGKGKIVRSFPMVPGIDLAGTIEDSSSESYQPGDRVILTGWGIGERHWGGYAELARVQSQWLVPLPDGLDLQQAMGIGTAGLTAMLAIMALEDHGLKPGQRPIVVTGATGGVGSIAVAMLAALGYHVVAVTGRSSAHDYLNELGATEITDRESITGLTRPLESERWGGAIDTVGGDMLAGLLKAMAYHTSVAVCGNAGGANLNTTVFPFILRGVNLLGIDSVMCPYERRVNAWSRLANDLPKSALERMIQVASLADVPRLSGELLEGKIHGRTVIDVTR